MKLFSILSLPGLHSCSAEEGKKTQHGNFTIHQIVDTERSKGKVLSREYETRSYLIRHQVFYRGKKIRLPSPLQDGTGYNYPWRVFILQDANVPAIIVASQHVFLLVEKGGKLHIRKLNQRQKDFSTFQWLHNEEAQPGVEVQLHGPQNDDRLDSSLIFRGGKFLMINRESILQVETLTVSHFNKGDTFEHQGWRLYFDGPAGFETAVGFSSRYRQVAFRAIKLDPEHEGKYRSAIFTFNYETDSIHLLPFSRTALRLESLDDLNGSLFKKYFEWNQDGKLRINSNHSPEPWKGRLSFADTKLINYRLYPVRETILPLFIRHLEQKFNREAVLSQVVDTSAVQKKVEVNIAELRFTVVYFKTDLKMIFELNFYQEYSELARDIIIQAAESFDHELHQRKHQEHFDAFSE